MKSAIRAALFLTVLFAIPIVPFLWLGESFEEGLLKSLREPSSSGVVISWVIGLLVADMFLPVPSSAVITYSGGALGVLAGTVVSWIGLSIGALGGFGLARAFGETIARRFSESEDIERMSRFTQRHGARADAGLADSGGGVRADARSRSAELASISAADARQQFVAVADVLRVRSVLPRFQFVSDRGRGIGSRAAHRGVGDSTLLATKVTRCVSGRSDRR